MYWMVCYVYENNSSNRRNSYKACSFGFKIRTYTDIIVRLIEVYEKMYFDELSDEEADYYNERIRHFESGDYSGTRKVDLNAIRK